MPNHHDPVVIKRGHINEGLAGFAHEVLSSKGVGDTHTIITGSKLVRVRVEYIGDPRETEH